MPHFVFQVLIHAIFGVLGSAFLKTFTALTKFDDIFSHRNSFNRCLLAQPPHPPSDDPRHPHGLGAISDLRRRSPHPTSAAWARKALLPAAARAQPARLGATNDVPGGKSRPSCVGGEGRRLYRRGPSGAGRRLYGRWPTDAGLPARAHRLYRLGPARRGSQAVSSAMACTSIPPRGRCVSVTSTRLGFAVSITSAAISVVMTSANTARSRKPQRYSFRLLLSMHH